jgi:uncharacterized protein (DUF1778 family)
MKRRKLEEARKSYMIRVRLSVEQRQILAAAADQAGLDLSSWLRSVGIERARQLGFTSAAPTTTKGG